MPYLIVTTDFSTTSHNAVNYACKCAAHNNLDVIVLHCYSLPIAFSDIPIPLPVDQAELAAKEGMDALLEEQRLKFPQVQMASKIIYGDVIDTLGDYAENNETPTLVIVGNAHTHDNPAWIDSTLLEAFRKVKFPVLGVPTDSTYEQVRKIGFAFDNNYKGSDLALLQLRDICRLFAAELHVFYANDTASSGVNDLDIDAAVKTLLNDIQPLYHVYHQQDVDSAINSFVATYNIDWLAIMPRKHNFFESIFHKSHTKIAINNTLVPILALHDNS